MLKIPYLDFTRLNKPYEAEMLMAYQHVFKNSWFILGKELALFEKEYADFNKIPYCVGVGNGLDALILSLKALGIGLNDEVIVPSNTYIASWLAVSYVGAIPIPVEPNPITNNIDPNKIEEKITSKTKAIMPVHLYGRICKMNEIMAIANKYELTIIEDNAQAQGAILNGKLAGTFGQINASSFYPGKNLGALGDAGAVTTDDIDLFEKVKLLRNYGSSVKYHNEIKGVNSRLDEMQAAFLRIKLRDLHQSNQERIRLAQVYRSFLENNEELTIPEILTNGEHVYHIFQIKTKQRDALKTYLDNLGIGTLIHYPIPPHLQPAYAELNYKKGDYPIAEEIANTTLSLPLFPGLLESEIEFICQSINNYFKF